MTNYRAAGNWPRAILAYTVAFIIFWFGNMGIRGLKEFLILVKLKSIKSIPAGDIFIWTIIIAGGVVPMFFLQKGTPWNTIQFFYYSLFFSSILAGQSATLLLSKINNPKFIILSSIFIVLLTIPTTLISLKDIYLPGRPPAMVGHAELEALNFLSKLPSGVVLTPNVKVDPYAPAPRPLYIYDSTAYVSALSGKTVFLEDEVNLNITDFPWQERRKQVENLFNNSDSDEARSFVLKHDIKYIYLPNVRETRPVLSDTQLGMTNVFENSQVAIWQRL